MNYYSAPYYYSTAAQFYLDNSGIVGGFTKGPQAQTLVTMDYTNALATGATLERVAYVLDIQTNPQLIVSHPVIDPTGLVLTFIASYGYGGIDYNLAVNATLSDGSVRSDILNISVQGGNMGCDPCVPKACPSPVGSNYQKATLSNGGIFGSAFIRYYISATPPTAPNVLDQWYNTLTGVVSEYITNGQISWWQASIASQQTIYISLYYVAAASQLSFPLTVLDIFGHSVALTTNATVAASVNGVRLVPVTVNQTFGDFEVDIPNSAVTFLNSLNLGDVATFDCVVPQ